MSLPISGDIAKKHSENFHSDGTSSRANPYKVQTPTGMGSTSSSPGDSPSRDGVHRRVDPVYRFGPYEFRSEAGQLSKHGIRLRLQMKPAQLLQALLESPSQLITRDALRQKLWPEGTYVDFEGSINTAINRLRAALNDAPENPRFIETVPRLGYRFIHPVVCDLPLQTPAAAALAPVSVPAAAQVPLPPSPPPLLPGLLRTRKNRPRWFFGAGATAAAALLAFAIYFATPLFVQSRSPRFRQLTFHSGSIRSARFLPGLQSVAYTSFLPGGHRESKTVDFSELRMKTIEAGGGLLSSVDSKGDLAFVSKATDDSADTKLVALSTDGKPMGEMATSVFGADWSPLNGELAVARHEGPLSVIEYPRGHAIFSTRGWVSDLRVSPSGDRVAFLNHPVRDDDGGFVEVVDRRGNVSSLSPMWSSASGLAWSASGREIWFSAGREGSTLALYRANLQGKVHEVFGSPQSIHLLDFARTGELLVAIDDARISMLTGNTTEENETDISKFDCSHVDAISQDGHLVLFTECGAAVGRHYTAYLRDLQTGATTRLGAGRALALTPDGKRAITIDPQDRSVLTLHDLTNGHSKTLANDGLEYQWARFLPGTARLLVGGARGGLPLSIYRQCPDNGSLEKVEIPWFLDDVVLSASGTRISGFAEGRLRAFDLGSSRELRLPGTALSLPLGWSPDGERLYAVEKRSLQMWSAKVDGGNVEFGRRLSGYDKPGFVSLAGAVAAPEAGVYTYSLHLSSSRLYLVSGLS